MDQSASDTRNKETVVNLEFDSVLQCLISGLEHRIEALGLCDCARETVKNKSR